MFITSNHIIIFKVKLKMRKNTKGVSAVIATILMLMITIAMAGLAYGFISGAFTTKTGVVIEIDATSTRCSGVIITVWVRNTGTMATTANLVSTSGTNSQGGTIGSVVCGASTVNLYAGGGAVSCATLTGTAGTNTIIASGPANSVPGTVYCPG